MNPEPTPAADSHPSTPAPSDEVPQDASRRTSEQDCARYNTELSAAAYADGIRATFDAVAAIVAATETMTRVIAPLADLARRCARPRDPDTVPPHASVPDLATEMTNNAYTLLRAGERAYNSANDIIPNLVVYLETGGLTEGDPAFDRVNALDARASALHDEFVRMWARIANIHRSEILAGQPAARADYDVNP